MSMRSYYSDMYGVEAPSELPSTSEAADRLKQFMADHDKNDGFCNDLHEAVHGMTDDEIIAFANSYENCDGDVGPVFMVADYINNDYPDYPIYGDVDYYGTSYLGVYAVARYPWEDTSHAITQEQTVDIVCRYAHEFYGGTWTCDEHEIEHFG